MNRVETIAKGIQLYPGECMAVLAGLEPDSVDSCVTDPPYGLQFMGKKWDKLWRNETDADAAYVERNAGQLTSRARKLPDYKASKPVEMQEWHEGWAREVFRVLKPGAHIVAFNGSRTYHRMASAIEDAGFEVRDCLMWIFGSGFPKSHNAGNGWGTALKPAYEPIIMARKPLIGTVAENVLKHGTGALNIDGCRINAAIGDYASGGQNNSIAFHTTPAADNPRTEQHAAGRWPANIIHDGSDEVVGAFPESKDGVAGKRSGANGDVLQSGLGAYESEWGGFGGGSAARFFYTAKADADDRIGSKHPTVKPVDLMQWLVRLVTPKGGLVLDPFAGTGTTGEAAFREGMRAVLIERETEYQDDIRRRMKLALAGPDERARESIKAKGLPIDAGPLFTPAIND
jgi:site-specific DNA-methyltransferase (adenine-specific)